ncbi:MAG: hypothetical protein LBP51_03180 [Deferribacteraceae bacterium]|jgi:hypothetical protein|nr:hypothetical protein [Deferribacteraceae bacterium]
MRLVLLLILFSAFQALGATNPIVIDRGYIQEIPINLPIQSALKGDGCSYLYDNGSIFIYTDEKRFSGDELLIPLQDNQSLKATLSQGAVWGFQQGYTAKSGAGAIHELKVKLPNCILGNVCTPDKPFSIAIADIPRRNLNNFRFFIGREDVSTLFYYNEGEQAFKVKEYYEPKFFSRFSNGNAFLSWRIGGAKGAITGNLRIIAADKAIRGKILTSTGKTPAYLAGRAVILKYNGSDAILPHTFSAVVDEEGGYVFENLPSFEYKPIIPDIAESYSELAAFESEAGRRILKIQHIVPDYEGIYSIDKSYRAGEFLQLFPAFLSPKLTGAITELIQLSGDVVYYKAVNNSIRLILPERRIKEDEITFSAKIGGKKVLFIFPHPVKIDRGYEQFAPFSGEGYYARTTLIPFDNGGVLEYSSKNLPTAALNSWTAADGRSVKVHLFNPLGKAADITSYFTWDNAAQRLSLNRGSFDALYDDLKNNQAALGVTFCGALHKNRCFRINREIRPGGASLLVDVSIPPTRDVYLLLRQIDNPNSPVVRVKPPDKDGKFRFTDIPEGRYQLLLADLSLKNRGSIFTSVAYEDNEEKAEINIELAVSPILSTEPADLEKAFNGNWTPLLSEPLALHKDDFKRIDLKSFNIPAVDEVGVEGYFPGEYNLHSDLSLTLYTKANNRDYYSVFTFKHRDKFYTLPIFYNGNDAPIVSEKGLDYTMCPKDRPYCSNAFVDVKGAQGGIYNGKSSLSLTFPFTFNRQDLSIVMEQVTDITELFLVNSRYNRITLKRSAIPAFLSYLSASASPIKITIKDRQYYLSLIAGYKSAEISVTDMYGAQNPIFAGLEANVVCEYGGGRIYSRNVAVSSSGFILLEDIPDCSYHITLIDRKRYFAGELEMNLMAGQNKKKAILQVSCVSADEQFVNNCVPIIPLISKNRLIAPETALLLTDIDLQSVRQLKQENIIYKSIGRAVILYAPKSKDGKAFQSKLILNDSSSVNIVVESVAAHRIRTLARPQGAAVPVLKLTGVNDAFTYLGGGLSIAFDNMIPFSPDEISISSKNTNITSIFSYDNLTRTLILLPSNQREFAALFNDGWTQLSINIGSKGSLYDIALILAISSSDISAAAVGEAAQTIKSASAILTGSRSANGFEFRQEVKLNNNKTAVFRQVPLGIYNLTIFDLESDVFGSTEVSIPPNRTDLYLDLEVSKIVE